MTFMPAAIAKHDQMTATEVLLLQQEQPPKKIDLGPAIFEYSDLEDPWGGFASATLIQGEPVYYQDKWQREVKSCYDMKSYRMKEQDKLQTDAFVLRRWVAEMKSGKYNVIRKALFAEDMDNIPSERQVWHGTNYDEGYKGGLCADGLLFVMMNGWNPHRARNTPLESVFKSIYMLNIAPYLIRQVATVNDMEPGGLVVKRHPWNNVCSLIESIIEKIDRFVEDETPVDADKSNASDTFMVVYNDTPHRYGYDKRYLIHRRHVRQSYMMSDICYKPMEMDTFCIGTG